MNGRSNCENEDNASTQELKTIEVCAKYEDINEIGVENFHEHKHAYCGRVHALIHRSKDYGHQALAEAAREYF